MLTFAGFYGLMALGLNLVWGMAGMINLGLVGFFAFGAYVSALATVNLGAPIPAGTALFQRTFTSVPIDAGGGTAQNTWSATGRVDHAFSDKTNLSGRFAWYRQEIPVGGSSDSPFPAFNTGQSFRSQNSTLALTHTFSPVLFNESRIGYSRTDPQQPLGAGSVNVMCLQYGELTALGTGDPMVFPGYVPANCQAKRCHFPCLVPRTCGHTCRAWPLAMKANCRQSLIASVIRTTFSISVCMGHLLEVGGATVFLRGRNVQLRA